jgi:hypothetical protein
MTSLETTLLQIQGRRFLFLDPGDSMARKTANAEGE